MAAYVLRRPRSRIGRPRRDAEWFAHEHRIVDAEDAIARCDAMLANGSAKYTREHILADRERLVRERDKWNAHAQFLVNRAFDAPIEGARNAERDAHAHFVRELGRQPLTQDELDRARRVGVGRT